MNDVVERPPDARKAARQWSWWTPLRIALGVTVLVCVLGYVQKSTCFGQANAGTARFTRLCYTDTSALYTAEGLNARTDANGAAVGPFSTPYRDEPVEYPPIIGGLMWTAAEVTSAVHGAEPDLSGQQTTTFFTVTALGLAALALVSTWTIAQLVGRPRAWDVMMVAASPVLLMHAYTNWDLAAVALTGLGLWAWSRGSPTWAGIALGLGVATKLYPIFVLLALVMLCARSAKWRAAAKAVGGAASAIVLAYIPAIVLSYQTPGALYRSRFVFPPGCPSGHPLRGWQWFTSFSQIRGVDWGSIWLVVQHIFAGGAIGRALGSPAQCNASPVTLNVLVAAAVGLVVVGVGVLVAKAPSRPRVGQIAFLLVAGFMIFNKLDSPQYALWLVPLAVLARPRWVSLMIWQLTEVGLGAANLYLLAHEVNPHTGLSLNVYCAWIGVRDLVLVILMSLVVREVLDPRRDVVRANGVDDPVGGELLVASRG